jgi:hypothetical protein
MGGEATRQLMHSQGTSIEWVVPVTNTHWSPGHIIIVSKRLQRHGHGEGKGNSKQKSVLITKFGQVHEFMFIYCFVKQ